MCQRPTARPPWLRQRGAKNHTGCGGSGRPPASPPGVGFGAFCFSSIRSPAGGCHSLWRPTVKHVLSNWSLKKTCDSIRPTKCAPSRRRPSACHEIKAFLTGLPGRESGLREAVSSPKKSCWLTISGEFDPEPGENIPLDSNGVYNPAFSTELT